MFPKLELTKDKEGNYTSTPVTAWVSAVFADSAILLALQYVESEKDFEAGIAHQVQLALTPPQALELAGELTRKANHALEPGRGLRN